MIEKFKPMKGEEMKKIILVVCIVILFSVALYSDPPTNVVINIDSDNSVLSWSESPNADYYNIYRSTKPDADFVNIDSVIVTTYIDSEAGVENKYFYYVTAEENQNTTVTDIDGNMYQTVQIGNQLWMAENLKTTHYRNGDAIQYVQHQSVVPNVWQYLSTGAYCYYNNSQSNQDIYGNLYNWYAVNDSRNIAPEGWHIPTDEEIKELEMALGMSESTANETDWRGTNEASKLADRADLWANGDLENNAEFGTSGFSFLPGGYRYYNNGDYGTMSHYGHLWSASENDGSTAWHRSLKYSFTDVYRYVGDKRLGYSVRCVRD